MCVCVLGEEWGREWAEAWRERVLRPLSRYGGAGVPGVKWPLIVLVERDTRFEPPSHPCFFVPPPPHHHHAHNPLSHLVLMVISIGLHWSRASTSLRFLRYPPSHYLSSPACLSAAIATTCFSALCFCPLVLLPRKCLGGKAVKRLS